MIFKDAFELEMFETFRGIFTLCLSSTRGRIYSSALVRTHALATLQASQGRGRRPAWPVDVARAS